MTYPVGGRETERLAALDQLKILGSAPDPIIDRICKLASEMFSVPIALVSFVGQDEQWFKARVGLDVDTTPREVAFCNYTILDDKLFVVPETLDDARFSASPLVQQEPRIRFYAGAPLSLDPGLRLGSLCLIDQKPRTLSDVERGWLRDLADILVGQLELHRSRIIAGERAEAVLLGIERLRLAVEATGLGTWDLVRSDGIAELSPTARSMIGLPQAGAVDLRTFLARVHEQDRKTIRTLLIRGVKAGDNPFHTNFRVVRPVDHEERWISMSGSAFDTLRGVRTTGTFQDVTERDRKSRALVESGKRLHMALHGGRAVAWERVLSSDWVTRSDNSSEVLGIGSGTFSEYIELIHPDDRQRLSAVEQEALGWEPVEFRFFPPGRTMMWLAARGMTEVDELGRKRLVGLTFDITARKAAEEEVWRVANHDALTGLPNRALFLHCLQLALDEAESGNTDVSLLFFDLDDFKDVNDTLGHEAGDHVLIRTATVLREHVVPGETIARLGGDEFAILLVSPGSSGSALLRARAMLDDLRTPFQHEGTSVRSRASIGIATSPRDDRRPSDLMKDADLALYQAKSGGRDRVVDYAPEFRLTREKSLALAREVRAALAGDQIVPFYQPKIDLRTGLVSGFEALARWRHPIRGVLTPGAFGEVFNDPEIARAIGVVMLREVASDLGKWLSRGLACGRIAVNFSSADFSAIGLAVRILTTLREAGVGPENLEVEVTETVFLGRSSEQVLVELEILHRSGVTVALDDFGTGFASLTHLKQFPVDNVKIDQTFIAGLNRDRGDEAIVSAVIGLGQSLNVQVTAEGIETAEQGEFLERLGCDHAQGYFYGKPMESLGVPVFLAQWAHPDPRKKLPRVA